MGGAASRRTDDGDHHQQAPPPPPSSLRGINEQHDSYYSDDTECQCRNPFRGLCGSSKNGGPRGSSRGAFTAIDSDPMGTPMPETPPHVRRKRMQDMGIMSSRYGGLEKEVTTQGQLTADGNGNGGSAGRVQQQQRGVSRQKSADVHEGPLSEHELSQKYELCEVLGVGSTSTCHRCRERSTGTAYACKIIDKHQIELRFRGMIDQFRTEVRALRSLHHPNIIYLKDVYITDEKIFIIMELMEGGELFDYVVQKGTLTEEEASNIVRQVTSALVYMHTKNIIHRDLKPENLLLVRVPRSPQDTPNVKIIDFGLSKCMEEPVARSFLGTRGYLAPEMLQRRQYTRQVDAWSLGVITYVLLCGCLPFDDDSAAVPSDDVLRTRFMLRFPRWAQNLSSSAKDLLSHLLDINPSTRYTAEQALDHPWVTGLTAPKNSYLQSPSLMLRKNAGGGAGSATKDHLTPTAATGGRNHRHQHHNHHDTPPKPPRHVRTTSI